MFELFRQNHEARIRKGFKQLGEKCSFSGLPPEIKGDVSMGSGCTVRGNVVLRTHDGGRIVVGDEVELADYAMLHSNGLIEIGSGTHIGTHTVVRDNNHLFQGTDAHWRITPLIVQPIRIGAGCYIGPMSYIMPGVTIGDGAVVGPGSIVNRDIGANEMWAGSPARLVADRKDTENRSQLKRHLDLVSMFGVPGRDGDTSDR